MNILTMIDNYKRHQVLKKARDIIYNCETYQLNPISKLLLYKKILCGTPKHIANISAKFCDYVDCEINGYRIYAGHYPQYQGRDNEYIATISDYDINENLFNGKKAQRLYEHTKKYCK